MKPPKTKPQKQAIYLADPCRAHILEHLIQAIASMTINAYSQYLQFFLQVFEMIYSAFLNLLSTFSCYYIYLHSIHSDRICIEHHPEHFLPFRGRPAMSILSSSRLNCMSLSQNSVQWSNSICQDLLPTLMHHHRQTNICQDSMSESTIFRPCIHFIWKRQRASDAILSSDELLHKCPITELQQSTAFLQYGPFAVQRHCVITKTISILLLFYPGLGLVLSEYESFMEGIQKSIRPSAKSIFFSMCNSLISVYLVQ